MKTRRYGMRVVAMTLAATPRRCNAGIDTGRLSEGDRRRTGVILGIGAAGIAFGEEQYEVYYREGRAG